MCRKARNAVETGTYHIIMRGSSEITLFKSDTDKDRFLNTIKKYQTTFRFKILAYCIMSTHVHLLIASNGANLSKFMHGINLSYAIYYNKTYKRHGHVFSDRFKSKIVQSEPALKFVSAYIHNNPKDISGYKNKVEDYKYSSLGIYLGIHEDVLNIVDSSIILNYYDTNKIIARKNYFTFVKARQALKDSLSNTEQICDSLNNVYDEYNTLLLEIKNFELNKDHWQYTSGKSETTKRVKPEDILSFICNNTNINNYDLQIKYRRNTTEFRAFSVFLMRSFCDINFKNISSLLGGISVSALCNLCNKGYELIKSNSYYTNILTKFLKAYPA